MLNILKLLLPSIFSNWFAPSLGSVGAAVGIASGIDSLFGGGDSGSGNVAGGAFYDPFAQYRGTYAGKLNELTGPNGTAAVLGSPGYQGGLQQGLQSLQRSYAGTGMTQSGNEQAALMGYGQNYFGTAYDRLLSNYAQLSGATQAPMNVTGQNQLNMQQSQAGWGAIAQGIGALGQSGVFNWGSGSGSGDYTGGINLSGYFG